MVRSWQPLGRDALAARVAQDIPEGWSVNLGIGIPTLVGNYVPPEREVVFHSENGIVGMGPAPAPDKDQPLADQCQQPVCHACGPAAAI